MMSDSKTAVTTNIYRLNTGKKLIRFAWLVEIIAAIVGVLIALLVAVSTYQDILREATSPPTHIYLSMVLGALPFLMVAVVEICKIPLATAFFHTKAPVWRSIFLFGLLLLMAITFETVMNGFERNFTQRTYVVNKVKKELNSINEKINVTLSESNNLSLMTEDKILSAYNAARAGIEQERDAKVLEIDKAISAQQESSTSDKANLLKSEINSINSEIEKIESRKFEEEKQIRDEHNKGIQGKTSHISNRVQQIENKIAKYENSLLELNSQEEKESGKKFFGSFFNKSTEQKYATQRKDVQNKIQNLIQEREQLVAHLTTSAAKEQLNKELKIISGKYENRITALMNKRSNLQSQLRSAVTKNDRTLKPIIDGLNRQRRDALNSAEERLKQEQLRYKSQKESLADREEQVTALQKDIASLRSQKVNLREKINELAQNSQVYRVAALWSGKDSPADVTNKELRFVTVVWFGSLAAITAWTGTLLAFAGLALQFPSNSSNQSRKCISSIRSLVVDIRKRVRAPRVEIQEIIVEKEVEKEVQVIVERAVPKEVIKEVPVDKVVFKEVAKDVIIKEYVYVPVVTDNPDAINKALRKFKIPMQWPLWGSQRTTHSPQNGDTLALKKSATPNEVNADV